MYNYLIKIEYDGTKFLGWQSQKNGKTVQDKIEKVLKKILKSDIRIIGAGRTDKGVHAYAQHANFQSRVKIEDRARFLSSINFFLRKNLITILDIKQKKKDFNARFNVKMKTYEYLIINRQGPLSINKNKAWHIRNKLDIKLMREGAKIFEGVHDFSTYRAASCSSISPIKKIKSVKISKSDDKIFIKFCSKSFLQNQVRSMVGCLKYLSEKKWSIQYFKKVLKSKKRTKCAPPAPASGLYLKEITY